MAKTFIAVHTGSVKRYALPVMAHCLMHLDRGDYEIHWGITDTGTEDDASYIEEVRNHMETVIKINPVPYYIHTTPITEEQKKLPYFAILRNRQKLRMEFLDSDCDQFLGVGGDNPPKHNAIQLLEDMESPIAIGLSYQRPEKNYLGGGAYPLLWKYLWTPDDLEGKDMPSEMIPIIRSGFVQRSHYLPAHIDPEWDNLTEVDDCLGGDGNILVQREVLERLGWYRPALASSSEDLLFMANARLLGYKTKCNKMYHVPHYDPDGWTF